jgi:TolB-like protein
MHLFFLLIAQVLPVLAGDDPDWVLNNGRSARYPSTTYLTGYGTAPSKEKDAASIAQDNARAQLTQSIVVTIKNEVIDKLEEQGKKSSQYFSSVTQSSTSLEISGVKTETYAKGKIVYALAYVSKTELVRIYTEKRNALSAQIKNVIASAEKDASENKIDEAARKYAGLFPLYDELKEATTILLVAGGGSAASMINEDQAVIGKTEIAMRIDQLLARSIASIDDAARAVAYQISQQVKTGSTKVLVTPLIYQDSKMTSPFARYFQQALETQMQKFAVWDVAQQARGFIPKSSQITRDLAVASGAQNIFEGSYWEQGSKIKIIGRLREIGSGKILAGAEALFDAQLIESAKLSYKPQNFEAALTDQKAFAKDEVISSDIQLEAWTNKGNEHLLFTEGEIMKIYVRVNRAAHIRIVYNVADGKRALLFNDHFINESMANQVVEIPAEFECAPPFGAESLIICARLDAFPTIPTYSEDGIEFLSDRDPGKAAMATRGFKKKDPESTAVQQTETRIMITTMRK